MGILGHKERPSAPQQQLLRAFLLVWACGFCCTVAQQDAAQEIPSSTVQQAASGFQPINSYVPMISRTAYALTYLQTDGGSPRPDMSSLQLAIDSSQADSGVATLYSPGTRDVVIVFQANNTTLSGPSGPTQAVPFLTPFVYTAEAPSAAVSVFEELISRDEAAGENMSLTQAVGVMASGDQLKRVTCIGDGPSGMLAILCGAWAGLNNPMANVEVFTFNTPWEGYNPQFAWAFSQLVTYRLLWPFQAPAASPSTTAPEIAAGLEPLVTSTTTQQAISLPNLPEQGILDMASEAVWGPEANLSPSQQLPPSECPIMICKSRQPLRLSCLGFSNETAQGAFGSQPYRLLEDASTGTTAAVSWDATDDTLYILWKYSKSLQSWVEDIKFMLAPELPVLDPFQPGVVFSLPDLAEIFPGLELELGFVQQFASLIELDSTDLEMLAAVEEVSGGVEPRHVVVSGFSLGGAVAELSAVWASQQWPAASVMVANQGAPKAGNSVFVSMFQATVGRGYKYINEFDQVPTLPPLPPYEHTPGSLWIRDGLVLAEVIPIIDEPETFWFDHNCWYSDPVTGQEAPGYVPKVDAAQKVTVPAWVF